MSKYWRPSPESFLFDANRNLSTNDLTVSKQYKSNHSRRAFAPKDLDLHDEKALNLFKSKIFEVNQKILSTDDVVEKLKHEQSFISHYKTRPDNKIIQNAVSTLCSDVIYREEDIIAHETSELNCSMRKKNPLSKVRFAVITITCRISQF